MRKLLPLIIALLILIASASYAVLNHVVIETRPDLNKWLALINVTDTVSGKVYNYRFSVDSDPSAGELDALAIIAKTRIQAELDCEANDLNLTTDEDLLLEVYRILKTDVILRIRAVPDDTAQQTKDYIAGEYPNSPFDFDELYAIWIGMINVSTWADFKTWVITRKFRGID